MFLWRKISKKVHWNTKIQFLKKYMYVLSPFFRLPKSLLRVGYVSFYKNVFTKYTFYPGYEFFFVLWAKKISKSADTVIH